MRRCRFFILAVVAVAPYHEACAAENMPDVAKRWRCDKGEFRGVSIDSVVERPDRLFAHVNKPGASLWGLTFSEPCELQILNKDRTLLADREGIVGKDDRGQAWKSCKVSLDGKDVFAFFPSSRNADAAEGAPTTGQRGDVKRGSNEMRRWTDASGRHTVEAEFLSVADGRVTLKKKSGATVTLAVEKLSAADREWLDRYEVAEATTGDGPTPEQFREFFAQHGGIAWVGQVDDTREVLSGTIALPRGTMVADVKKPIDVKLVLNRFGKPMREVQAEPRGAKFVDGVGLVLEAQRWEYERIGIFVCMGKVLEYYEFPQKSSQESSAASPSSVSKSPPADPTTAESDSPPATPTKTKKDAGFATVPEGWPKRSGDLSGRDEVRVKNPNDFQVRVGLRSAGKGQDFVVPAAGVQSVKVPNGKYDIYFQYSTDPTGLYQGDSFTLADNGVEIQIVKVVNGNYGIRKVK